MNTINVERVVGETANKLRGYRKLVRKTFQPSIENMHLLLPQEQLNRFLKMTPADLWKLREQHGDDDVRDYIKAQMTNYLKFNRG